MTKMDEINKFREEINEIDEKILDLLNKRGEIAKKIGELKNKKKIEISQPAREKEIIERLKNLTTILEPNSIDVVICFDVLHVGLSALNTPTPPCEARGR